LPPAERRNYKHALDGVLRVVREEGLTKLFNGAAMATSRAVFMTIGQLSFYDQIKQTLISSGYMKDTPTTHFSSSFLAASIATVLTQPLDVMKTRMMNAKPGQFSVSCFLTILCIFDTLFLLFLVQLLFYRLLSFLIQYNWYFCNFGSSFLCAGPHG
ncbi:unnamed protein product, partial [Gongylonema pulchrum]|uniref:Mitochondrial dicarboxylate carrier n=1 Tax=Gongylonema pulchrum TaxID=637853 RepID=A0A183DHM7_9BILA